MAEAAEVVEVAEVEKVVDMGNSSGRSDGDESRAGRSDVVCSNEKVTLWTDLTNKDQRFDQI